MRRRHLIFFLHKAQGTNAYGTRTRNEASQCKDAGIRQGQSGNVLWIILLAVALLALLSGVISRNSSSIDQSGSVEQARIKASSILRYSKSIDLAAQKLMFYGCSENEISFENSDVNGYENPQARADNSCHIFDTRGGAIGWKTTSLDNSEWYISKHAQVPNSLDNGGNDITVILRNLPETVCEQINRQLHGWTTIPEWNTATGHLWDKADGAYGTGGANLILPSPGPAWKQDVMAACFNNTQISEYDFYHIVILR